MRAPLRITAPLLVATVAAWGACGGNVIVDGDTGGATSTTGTGFGGGEMTGAAGTTGTGLGGASTSATGTAVTNATVSTGTGCGGDVGCFTSTSTGFGGSMASATSSASTGGGSGDACLDVVDTQILDNEVLYPLLVMCAEGNANNPGGETMCIEGSSDLTPACVGCFVDYVECGLQICLGSCESGPDGASCMMCRIANCDAAFLACSGAPAAPGSTTCNGVLDNGTQGTGWQANLPADGFLSGNAFDAYGALETCACGAPQSEGCRTVCDDAFSNGPPDFCNDAVASPECLSCLTLTCGADFMECVSN